MAVLFDSDQASGETGDLNGDTKVDAADVVRLVNIIVDRNKQTAQDVYTYTQAIGLTLTYNFNASNSKYRGTGAGNDEKNRL